VLCFLRFPSGESYPFVAPVQDPLWNASWAMTKISAGYAFGAGVAGRARGSLFETRVCIIGDACSLA
jgi:hypothetical protein